MFTWTMPRAATELASSALLSWCHEVSGRIDVTYPPEFGEGVFCEVGFSLFLRTYEGLFFL
jgi:hypothetical protein